MVYEPTAMNFWTLKNFSILIVDDFAEVRSMLRLMIINFGAADVHVAKSGEEAVALMHKKHFHIVLCDYNLGQAKDGQQVLEEARHKKLLLPTDLFIMITAEKSSYMVMGAIEYYPDDYLSKPFTRATLLHRLRKLVGAKQACSDILQAQARNELDLALRLCDQAIAEGSKHRQTIRKIKAELLLQTGNYTEARELYQAIVDERELHWAMTGLAQSHLLLGDDDSAEEILCQVIDGNTSYMQAYDWLAKLYVKKDAPEKAQEVLLEATAKSPKSLLRQRRLGELSLELKDYETSRRAFQCAVEHGTHSCYRTKGDYAGLSKAQLGCGREEEAIRTAKSISRKFPHDEHSEIYAQALVCNLLQRTESPPDTEQMLEAVLCSVDEKDQAVPDELALLLADTCLRAGRTDTAERYVRDMVRNNHNDSELLEEAKKIYAEAGLAAQGEELVTAAQTEVVDLNNQGVQLAEAGRFEDSVDLFIKAAAAMPGNLIILLNAVQSLLLAAQHREPDERRLEMIKEYLQRAKKIDGNNPKYLALLASYRQLTGGKQS